MKYGFIKEHQALLSVSLMCRPLAVSSSGFYNWLTSTRELEYRELDANISKLFIVHKGRYGTPRFSKELKNKGIICRKKRVANRMKRLKLKAVAKKKYKVTTDSEHNKPIFENVLNRNFHTTTINQKWAGDITYVATDEGWLYLAVIIDLHSRAIIGWSMGQRMAKDLVCDALLMALFNRKLPRDVVMHTNRESQYCSKRYRRIIENNKPVGSISRKGNCWDNTIAESFFHTLKVELVYELRYKTRADAKRSIFQ